MAVWPLVAGVQGAAIFHTEKDKVERRRSLHRDWSKPGKIIRSPGSAETFVSIGMNPSRAGENCDDPTVRKEYTWAMNFPQYSRYTKFNVCDAITPYPKDLLQLEYPNSKGNHEFIRSSLKNMNSDILVSWGNLPKGLEYIAEDLLAMLRKDGHTLYCFAVNKSGTPRHVRFIQHKDMKLQRFW
jgi:hypothetical protein